MDFRGGYQSFGERRELKELGSSVDERSLPVGLEKELLRLSYLDSEWWFEIRAQVDRPSLRCW